MEHPTHHVRLHHFCVSTMCAQGHCRYVLRQVAEECVCHVALDITLICWSSPPCWHSPCHCLTPWKALPLSNLISTHLIKQVLQMLTMDLFYNAFLFCWIKATQRAIHIQRWGDKEDKRKLKTKPPENSDLAGYSNKTKQPI